MSAIKHVKLRIHKKKGQMKAWLTIFLIVFVAEFAIADRLRLLLVPAETSIKPGATVTFEAYLYNPGSAAVKVPPLEFVSAMYVIDDVTGVRMGRAGSSGVISTAPRADHVLQAKSIERRTIDVEIPAEAGDLVRVYAELGKKPALRSNSVLLFCPPKGRKLH
jgi:hypothetical protein